jgi:phage-related minor tail protein
MGAGGRGRATTVRRLAETVRREIASGLRADRALAHLRRFAAAVDREPFGRLARGERAAAKAAVHSIERRTGIPLV